MANFYVEIQGSRGAVHRLGQGEARAEVRSWNEGIEVIAKRDDSGNSYSVYRTGGSNRNRSQSKLLTIKFNESGDINDIIIDGQ